MTEMELQDKNVSKFNLSSKENFAETDSLEKRSNIKWRYVMAALFFFAFFNMVSIQSSLSVAIVSMTQPTLVENVYITNRSRDGSNSSDVTLTYQAAQFEWDSQVQGIVLGGFFWGYVIPLVISGVLADKFGSKNVMLVGGFLAAVGTILGPIAAVTNVYLFIATRVISGLGLSGFAPCYHTIMAKWFHRNERSRMMAFVYSGFQFGITYAFSLTGYLCKEYPTDGWKWSFYISGASIAVWLAIFFFLGFSTPKENPWMSDQEKLYIESGTISPPKSKSVTIPWMSIIKSRPMWSIMAACFGQGWGFYTLMTQLPLYMKSVLGFDLSESGMMASLPFLCMVLVGYITSFISDFITKKKFFSTVTIRRIFSLVGILPCGFCLLAITFIENEPMVVYILLVVGLAMFSCLHSGCNVNHIDLAPNYAGILQGVINTSLSTPGILSPYVTGVILGSEAGADSWNIVFYISSGLLIGTVLIYVIFAEAQAQPWNNFDERAGDVETTVNPKVESDVNENAPKQIEIDIK